MVTKNKSPEDDGDDKAIEQAKLLAAIKEGLAAGTLSISDLGGALSAEGVALVAAGMAEVKTSRKEKVMKWLTARELEPKEKEVIQSLSDIIGKGETGIEPGTKLNQAQIDELMEEILPERESQDIIKGRIEAIRDTILNHVSAVNDNDPYATGDVASLKHGYKFSVTKAELGGEADYNQLEGVVAPDVWTAISDEVTVRQVNPQKLAEAMNNGTVTLEQFNQVVPAKTISRRFTVRPLKKGDDI